MSTEEKPEEKFKILINTGIGLSALIVIGIFIAIFWTVNHTNENGLSNAERQRMYDSLLAAQDMYGDYDYYYDDPGDYYDYGPGPTERENDSLNDAFRNAHVYAYQTSLLDHLQKESDNCARLIRELRVSFQDTLKKSGVSYSTSTSISFFSNTGKDEALFSALFAYREDAEAYATDAGIYDVLSYRMYLPLMERSDYAYVKSWDKTEFEKNPDSVIEYLDHMEMDLRYYENHLLWDLMY